MIKAEVLGKRVVVQHIPLGGLMEWEPRIDRNPNVDDPREQTKVLTTPGSPEVMQARVGLSVDPIHALSRRIR